VLADSGVGLWVKPAPFDAAGPIFVLGETDPAIEQAQRLLARFGYDVTANGYLDSTTRDAVAGFQRHFRPARVDGIIDPSTVATLERLLAAQERRGN
jgi:N-acetylmuramoyl-L-alanine amidase